MKIKQIHEIINNSDHVKITQPDHQNKNYYRLKSPKGLFRITLNGLEWATWTKHIEINIDTCCDNSKSLYILGNGNDVVDIPLENIHNFKICGY